MSSVMTGTNKTIIASASTRLPTTNNNDKNNNSNINNNKNYHHQHYQRQHQIVENSDICGVRTSIDATPDDDDKTTTAVAAAAATKTLPAAFALQSRGLSQHQEQQQQQRRCTITTETTASTMGTSSKGDWDHGMSHQLAYNVMTIQDDGKMMRRSTKAILRERHGYCTECEGVPLLLYIVMKKDVNHVWLTKKPRRADDLCMDGICFRCHPERNPNSVSYRTKPAKSVGIKEWPHDKHDELAYSRPTMKDNGMFMERAEKAIARERCGYCTECQDVPVLLYDVKKNPFCPDLIVRKARAEKDMCADGVCFRCNPEQNPERSIGRTSSQSQRSQQQEQPSRSDTTPTKVENSNSRQRTYDRYRLLAHGGGGTTRDDDIVVTSDVKTASIRERQGYCTICKNAPVLLCNTYPSRTNPLRKSDEKNERANRICFRCHRRNDTDFRSGSHHDMFLSVGGGAADTGRVQSRRMLLDRSETCRRLLRNSNIRPRTFDVKDNEVNVHNRMRMRRCLNGIEPRSRTDVDVDDEDEDMPPHRRPEPMTAYEEDCRPEFDPKFHRRDGISRRDLYRNRFECNGDRTCVGRFHRHDDDVIDADVASRSRLPNRLFASRRIAEGDGNTIDPRFSFENNQSNNYNNRDSNRHYNCRNNDSVGHDETCLRGREDRYQRLLNNDHRNHYHDGGRYANGDDDSSCNSNGATAATSSIPRFDTGLYPKMSSTSQHRDTFWVDDNGEETVQTQPSHHNDDDDNNDDDNDTRSYGRTDDNCSMTEVSSRSTIPESSSLLPSLSSSSLCSGPRYNVDTDEGNDDDDDDDDDDTDDDDDDEDRTRREVSKHDLILSKFLSKLRQGKELELELDNQRHYQFQHHHRHDHVHDQDRQRFRGERRAYMPASSASSTSTLFLVPPTRSTDIYDNQHDNNNNTNNNHSCNYNNNNNDDDDSNNINSNSHIQGKTNNKEKKVNFPVTPVIRRTGTGSEQTPTTVATATATVKKSSGWKSSTASASSARKLPAAAASAAVIPPPPRPLPSSSSLSPSTEEAKITDHTKSEKKKTTRNRKSTGGKVASMRSSSSVTTRNNENMMKETSSAAANNNNNNNNNSGDDGFIFVAATTTIGDDKKGQGGSKNTKEEEKADEIEEEWKEWEDNLIDSNFRNDGKNDDDDDDDEWMIVED